jgi:hypothetical protein
MIIPKRVFVHQPLDIYKDKYLYAVGSKELVRKLRPYNNVKEINVNSKNMTTNLNRIMKKMHMDGFHFDSFEMDKNGITVLNKSNDISCKVKEIDYVEFLESAYKMKLGIALMYAIIDKTDDFITLKTQFIEYKEQNETTMRVLKTFLSLGRQFPMVLNYLSGDDDHL